MVDRRVFYQIYPCSYACAGSSQGVGDLRGIIDRLDHVVGLGVDAVWLSPVFCSPQVDHGYDVSDYYAIDPIFGTMADFDELLQGRPRPGLRVLLDMVPNHTSTSMRGSPPRWRLGVGHVNATGTCSATAAAPMVQSLPPMCSDRSRRHRCGPGH